MRMRWQMMRLPHQRRRFVAALSIIPLLCVATVVTGLVAPEEFRFNFALLAPTTYASFAVLAVLAPASSAGGSELFPGDQLVAYPVSERTVFASTVLLAPANLAWVTHFAVLLGITAYVAAPGPLVALALVTSVTYAVAVTLAGQSIAWWLEGLRQRRAGRWAVRLVAVSAATSVIAVHATGHLTDLLNRLPTKGVAISAVQASEGHLGRWVLTLAGLASLGVMGLALGQAGCRWALNRASDGGMSPESKPVQRRQTARRELGALIQLDRANVWRSAPLRRGALVLAVLPGVLVAVTQPRWDSMVLLTGLVAAGAGLLFGVNAFGMDGPGALTLEGLPIDPRLRFWAKAVTVVEFSALTTGLAVAVAALRAQSAPTSTQVAALAASLTVCCLAVGAFCMRVSLRAPHRADLRGRRDTPAPPGAMIAYSARLAWRTTWISMVLSLVALAPWAWLPLLVATPMACLALLSLVHSARDWSVDTLRARVITTVSTG